MLLFHSIVVIGAAFSGHLIIAMIVSGAVFIGNWRRYFVGVPMHCGLRSNVADFCKCARSIKLDLLTGFLYWHMDWHLEHHMYAAVPCYNLKRLHQAVAQDMPVPRTLWGAWREMRSVWRRQRCEPDHAFDTPVPSEAVVAQSVDQLESSMGDLAPRTLADDLPTSA